VSASHAVIAANCDSFWVSLEQCRDDLAKMITQ
jgi:hypothetical protein